MMRCLEDKKFNMKHKIHLPILIEQDEVKVYIVSCPTLKRCHSYGNTIDEAIKNIEEVIVMRIEEKVKYEK